VTPGWRTTWPWTPRARRLAVAAGLVAAAIIGVLLPDELPTTGVDLRPGAGQEVAP
jgi:negative regulator of sigma E activity